jgi:SAM-dependent methyltransferase
VDDFRAASLASWSTVAPDWGELTSWIDYQLGAAADWMIDAVHIEPGERVLELAAGPGTLSLLASRIVGDEGRVICTDFAEEMVEVSRRRLASEGTSVECRVMDAEAIDVPDGSVDVVLSRMGYMLMAEPPVALRETARALAPGGRLALAVWSDAESNPWAALPMQAVMAHVGAAPAPPGTPGLWALADERHLRTLLEDAALKPLAIEQLGAEVEYASLAHWFEMTKRLAGPLRAILANLDGDARAAVERRMEEAAAPYMQADGRVVMPERMVVASARCV